MAKVKAVPEGMHTLTAQLTVDGAAEAIEFFKRAFGAEEVSRVPDPSGKKIWHAHLKIGDSTFFVNDAFPDMGGHAHPTDLWLYTENVDALYKRATDAGAQVASPVMDMFWGDRMGQVKDRWGNRWTLVTHTRDMSPDEMKKAQAEFVAKMKR